MTQSIDMTEDVQAETNMCCDTGTKGMEVVETADGDTTFHLTHDTKFGTLLMLLPAVTLAFFSVAGML